MSGGEGTPPSRQPAGPRAALRPGGGDSSAGSRERRQAGPPWGGGLLSDSPGVGHRQRDIHVERQETQSTHAHRLDTHTQKTQLNLEFLLTQVAPSY